MNILLTGAFKYSEDNLCKIGTMGFDIDFLQYESDKVEHPEKYDAVICNGLFLHNNIEAFSRLKYIQLTSAGYDRVPMEYIKAHGIEIHNARGVYSIPMAEWTVLKTLELYKKSRTFYKNQSDVVWEKQRGLAELYGKNVTIVGCGSIGTEAAKRFKAFGVHIIGVDLFEPAGQYYDEFVHISRLNDALEKTDVLVLTLPLTDETYHLIDAECFEIMKSNAVLINISRGKVVDEIALTDALKEKRIGGATLDVFEEEPLDKSSLLWEMDNVIITPHNSFVGDGNHERMFEVIINNLKGVALNENHDNIS